MANTIAENGDFVSYNYLSMTQKKEMNNLQLINTMHLSDYFSRFNI